MVLPADGTGDVREVVATDFAEIDPNLSPDGKWLAYASNRTGRNEVWVQGYPEGAPVRVSNNGGFEPHWSPDGRELFYRQGSAVMGVTVLIDGEIAFTPPVELFNDQYFTQPDAVVSSYDVASDGRFLMIQASLNPAAMSAQSTGIVVVQNWTEELKRRVPSK